MIYNDRPIRILQMIASLGIGGSQTFIMNLYRKIDREKIQFDFIIDHTENMFFQKEIESLGGRIYVMPTFKGKNIFEVKKAWNDFFKEHKEYKILHSHSRSYASVYIPIAKKYGLKTIIHSHNTSNGRGISAITKSVLQYPLRYQANYFMACSKGAGEWLFGKKVCTRDNFNIISNAIDSQKYIFNEKIRQNARKQFKINDQFVLGYLARVTNQKNPLFVIDVFAQLLKINPQALLLFVGDGELLDDVRSKLQKMRIQQSVIVTGARTDVIDLMNAMDVYILPSFWEGFGISLIEAEATGMHCIVSDCIQEEAIITKNVEVLSINDGAQKWARTIYNMDYFNRNNESDIIKKAGYDIEDNVRRLCEFYKNL